MGTYPPWMATVGGIGSGRSLHLGAAGRVEHWRAIDLTDLRRMGLLKPIVGGRIRAIRWKNTDGGLHELRTPWGDGAVVYLCSPAISSRRALPGGALGRGLKTAATRQIHGSTEP